MNGDELELANGVSDLARRQSQIYAAAAGKVKELAGSKDTSAAVESLKDIYKDVSNRGQRILDAIDSLMK